MQEVDWHGIVDSISRVNSYVNNFVWGVPMIVAILGVGLLLTVLLRFLPLRKLPLGFKMLFKGRTSDGKKGDISPFNSLMTSLAATIGTGNIAGVATAIYIGGPGAIFWMWMTALVGMSTKYAEAVCAVKFRQQDDRGRYVGGPMYYIQNGLGKNWKFLAILFAFFASLAAFGIGNMTQSNSIANALNHTFKIPHYVTGLVVAILVSSILFGGIKRIGSVAGTLVPFMALGYAAVGVLALILNASHIPDAFSQIIHGAFNGTAATGGFTGAAVWMAIRYGVARGIFSNEAGLGSAPIAHASADTHGPVSQGLIAMLGTFIDTIVVGSFTALVIITSGVWENGKLDGAILTAAAFDGSLKGILPHVGGIVVAIALTIFAFTTILGWGVYGTRTIQYLFGTRAIIPFRVLWVLAAFVGSILNLKLVWAISDTFNALMAIPNLIALVLLSPVIIRVTREFFATKGQSENNPID